MNDALKTPKTLLEVITHFADERVAFEYLKARRWPDGKVVCPHCGCFEKIHFIESRMKWRCNDCTGQFSVKVGTIFEASPIKLSKWLPAMWLIANAKNGISSYELHRSLGVTQKTGWFMLHRIREAMRSGSIELMGGPVESDESFIGGSKRHKRGPKSHIPKGGSTHKTAVQGIFDRTTGEIRATPVRSTGAKYLHGTIIQNVKPKAVVYTDMAGGYMSLARRGFAHQAVDHLAEYVNGEIHTNNLECFWNLLKRSIKGTYVSVEPFHLHRYLDEHTFRFNLHEGNDSERFLSAVSGTFGRRLTYARLTGKELVQAG